MASINDHIRETFDPTVGSVNDLLHAFWSNRPWSKVLAKAASYQSSTITNAATNAATSVYMDGMAVQWEAGYRPVEVCLEGWVLFNGISQAAGLKVGVTAYICDISLASNAAVASGLPYATPQMVFHDTTTGFHEVHAFKASAIVTAAPGTLMTMHGRAYQSTNPAATWSAYIGAGLLPTFMTATELS